MKRLNKTLASILAAYVNLSHDDWDEHLPLAVFAINSARQDTTERTPYEMLYGRVPSLAMENQLPMPSEPPEEPTEREERLKRWREEARLAIGRSHENENDRNESFRCPKNVGFGAERETRATLRERFYLL